MRKRGAPKAGAPRLPERTVATFSLSRALNERISKLARQLDGDLLGNRSEVVRQAIELYTKRDRLQFFIKLRQIQDRVAGVSEDLKKLALGVDASQRKLEEDADELERLVKPAQDDEPPVERVLLREWSADAPPKCTPEVAEQFIRKSPHRAWEQVLHATDGRAEPDRRPVWINALLGRLHTMEAVRAFVEQVLRESQESAPKPPEAPA